MSMLRKIQRVGKRASKFQYSATFQSVVVECQRDKWIPNKICVAWSRRGRRLITVLRPWQASPDNKMRGVVVWPEPEVMEITVTLYKGPRDKSYETKEWEFSVIDVDPTGRRKVLATTSINMVRYASSLPYDHDLHLKLKPVSRKIKKVILEVSLSSLFLREGKATDDDMMSIASMMSISNLSTIGFLEDEEDDDFMWSGGRSISPPSVPESVLSTDKLMTWAQQVTESYSGVKITNMTTSWRNGLGFLAIIHYHRPDLLDFELVPPNSIKENNKLAFELARNLGISCSLTPNMMLTSTIPDKLSVTSFVYQMYQYFNRATVSAISRETGLRAQSPNGSADKTSPFDLSVFNRFTFEKLSPVTSPQSVVSRTAVGQNLYSRHSRDSSITENVPSLPADTSSTSEIPLIQDGEGEVATVAAAGRDNGGSSLLHSTPKSSGKEAASEGSVRREAEEHSKPGEGRDPTVPHEDRQTVVSPRVVGLRTDKRPSSAPPAHMYPPLMNGHSEDDELPPPSKEVDRALEFENLRDSEDSEDVTTTTSSCSLDTSQSGTDILDLEAGEEAGGRIENGVRSQPGEEKEEEEKEGEVSPKGHKVNSPNKGSSSGRRKLPTLPTESHNVDKTSIDRKKIAREMLKAAHAKGLSASFDAPPKTQTTTKGKYREQAQKMIFEALQGSQSPGTPEKTQFSEGEVSRGELSPPTEWTTSSVDEEESPVGRRAQEHLSQVKDEFDDEFSIKRTSSEGSIDRAKHPGRHGGLDQPPVSGESSPPSTRHASMGQRPSSARTAQRRQQPAVPRTNPKSPHPLAIKSTPQRRTEPPQRRAVGCAAAHSTGENLHSEETSEEVSEPKEEDRGEGSFAKRTWSEGRIERRNQVRPGGGPALKTTRHSSLSTNQRPSSASAAIGLKGQRKPRTLPVAKPVSSQMSRAARCLLEQKTDEPDSLEPDGAEDLPERTGLQEGDASRLQQRKTDEEEKEEDGAISPSSRDRLAETPPPRAAQESVVEPEESAEGEGQSKVMDSPSAWSTHGDDLSQDMLVTQSEYVRCELMQLKEQLETLEERANNIEADIRNVMSVGNKEEEEKLMQEWFGILNRKNELIKRQIELNLLEKEEDLEKSQFFLNRELRPLMEIPEDQKTPEQKEREAHLLKELLELIDDRDKLERRKMTAERDANAERSGFARAQAKTGELFSGSDGHSTRQGSRECVIS